MSKPNAYTIQLVQKASGALQMRLMVPGYEAIVMHPKELREVASGIESMFGQLCHAPVAKPQAGELEDCLKRTQKQLSDVLGVLQGYQERLHGLSGRVLALEKMLHTNLSANTSARLRDQSGVTGAMSQLSAASEYNLGNDYVGGDFAVGMGALQQK